MAMLAITLVLLIDSFLVVSADLSLDKDSSFLRLEHPSLALLPRGHPIIIADRFQNATVNKSGHCALWDLALPSVPPATAWKRLTFTPRKEYSEDAEFPMIAFTSNSEDVFSYWKEMARTNNASGVLGLHEAIGLPVYAVEAISWARKNKLRLSEASMNNSVKSGLFLLLRGDSHMRITFNMLLKQLTQNKTVLAGVDYNKKTYHLNHLISCPPHPDNTTIHVMDSGCIVEIVNNSKIDMSHMPMAFRLLSINDFMPVFTSRLSAGWLCILWTLKDFWDPFGKPPAGDFGTLQFWLELNLMPDLVLVNDGAHYREYSKDTQQLNVHHQMTREYYEWIHSFPEQFDKWLMHAAKTLESLPPESMSTLVITSTPPSQFSSLPAQVAAYEHVQEAVKKMQSPAKHRVSYVDFHTLAAIDVCGFPIKFPFLAYDRLDEHNATAVDRCNHHLKPAEVHLMGGAYMHLIELALNLLRLQTRRCDPLPYKPAAIIKDDTILTGPVTPNTTTKTRAFPNILVHGIP